VNPDLYTQIVDFVRSIDIAVIERPIFGTTILPGITIDHGSLVADRAAVIYPGDLLHEAGHLAVVPSRDRQLLHQNAGNDGGCEMAAIAWSFAAAVHLNIAPSVVFHADGYRGGADSLLDNFQQGRYIGVPILVWRGLAASPASGANGGNGYPHMRRWLAD